MEDQSDANMEESTTAGPEVVGERRVCSERTLASEFRILGLFSFWHAWEWAL